MAKKSCFETIQNSKNISGEQLSSAIKAYLNSRFPKFLIESRQENNKYCIRIMPPRGKKTYMMIDFIMQSGFCHTSIQYGLQGYKQNKASAAAILSLPVSLPLSAAWTVVWGVGTLERGLSYAKLKKELLEFIKGYLAVS